LVLNVTTHTIAYYLDPYFHFRLDDFKGERELYKCMRRLVKDITERKNNNL